MQHLQSLVGESRSQSTPCMVTDNPRTMSCKVTDNPSTMPCDVIDYPSTMPCNVTDTPRTMSCNVTDNPSTMPCQIINSNSSDDPLIESNAWDTLSKTLHHVIGDECTMPRLVTDDITVDASRTGVVCTRDAVIYVESMKSVVPQPNCHSCNEPRSLGQLIIRHQIVSDDVFIKWSVDWL